VHLCMIDTYSRLCSCIAIIVLYRVIYKNRRHDRCELNHCNMLGCLGKAMANRYDDDLVECVDDEFVDTVKTKKKQPKRGFSRKALYDVLISRGFSEEICIKAVNEYERVTGRQNYQDARRKGLLFACILMIYKTKGIEFDLLSIAEQMQIDQATASQGVRCYGELVTKLGERVDTLECEPIEYVHLFVKQLSGMMNEWCSNTGNVLYTADGSMNIEHICRCIESILNYLDRIDVKSATKSATPRCVAAAAIYFHFIALGSSIDKEKYANLCGCQTVSIDKLSTDIGHNLKKLRETRTIEGSY
jgi:transcription initiation factor TFIIIB Brf1 subunit/transcription initiation factor TFIIB